MRFALEDKWGNPGFKSDTKLERLTEAYYKQKKGVYIAYVYTNQLCSPSPLPSRNLKTITSVHQPLNYKR